LRTYARADFIALIDAWYGSTIVHTGAMSETQTNMEVTPVYAGQYVMLRFWSAASGAAFDNWFALLEPHADGTLTVSGAHWHRGTSDMPFINGFWFYEPVSLEQPIYYGAYAGFGGVSFVLGALPSISEFLDGTYHAGYPGYGPLRIRAAGYYPIGGSVNLTIRWANFPATGTNQSRGFGFILPGDDGNLYYYHYLNREHLQNMSGSGANNPEVYNVIAPAYPDGCILRIGLGSPSYSDIANSVTHVNFDTHIAPTADYIIDNADWQNADDTPAIPFPDEYTYISTNEAGGVDCYSMQIGGIQKRANGKWWVVFYMTGYSDYTHYAVGYTTLRIKAFEFDPATLVAKLKYIGTCVLHTDVQIPVSGVARGNDQYLHITITESGPVATVNVYGPIYRSTFSLFEP